METKKMPLHALTQEEGANDLVKSEAMRPYLNLALAQVRHSGIDDAMQEIRSLPLEQRYVWRIAPALKWAFADCDDASAEADRRTMVPDDFEKIKQLVHLRPAQFCIILKALFGEEEMLRMMTAAITMARQMGSSF